MTDAISQTLPAIEAAHVKSRAIAGALRKAARKSRLPFSIVSGGGGFRARRSDKLYWWAVAVSGTLMFLIPLLCASVYFGIVASNQYATELKFALRSAERGLLDTITGLTGLPSSQQSQDSQIVVNYIRSRGMVEAIQSKIDLRTIYSHTTVDYLSRLDPTEPVEELVYYWRRRVDANLETYSGIISVNVRAFSPQESMAVAQAVIDQSEALANEMSQRARGDALRLSEQELKRAENRLREATLAMQNTRNTEGVLDAHEAAKAIETIVTTLRGELAKKEQDAAVQRSSMSADALQLRIVNTQIATLKEQIAKFTDQVASINTDGKSLANRLGTLNRSQIDLNIAQQQYAAAATSYEMARADMEVKKAYLVSFLMPSLAEKSLYPRRWFGWLIVVGPALLIWLVFIGLVTLIRDNMAS